MADNIDLLMVPRPGGEELRLTLSDFKGHRFVNARVWFNAGGEMRPGKQGVTLPLHALADIRQALERAEALAQAEGLIPAASNHAQPHQ